MSSEKERDKTPPLKSNPPAPAPTSTPLKDGGTASECRSGVISTNMGSQVKLLEKDLEKSPVVPFHSMIKALLALQYLREVEPARKKSGQAEDQGEPQTENVAKDFAERHFQAMLEHSIQFCNDRKRSTILKENLKQAFRTKSEKQRYLPLVRGLNSILSHFQATHIGELEANNDFVFMVNDPLIIKSVDVAPSGIDDPSLKLSKDAPRCTERKPDIIDPSIEHLRKLMPNNQDFGLDDWIKIAGYKDRELRDARIKTSSAGKTSWDDISHCWELKSGKPPTEEEIRSWIGRIFDAENIFSTPKTEDEGSKKGKRLEHKRHLQLKSEGTLGGRKRSREGDHDSFPGTSYKANSRKKHKSDGGNRAYAPGVTSETSENSGDSEPSGGSECTSESECKLSARLQCGFYAVELLRSKWDRTHAIVILLDNERLSLRWHDAQGCIGTASINVLSQLPLLVVMILLFQRFGQQMKGNAGWSLQAKVDGKDLEYTLPDYARSGWEMKGRRLVIATPLVPLDSSVPASGPPYRTRGAGGDEKTQAKLKRREDLFFKLSWREETRNDEALVVETAKERAKYYLKKHAADVLNHLPEIKYSESDPLFSTGHIRGFLEINKKGARIPSFMLSQKLHSLDTVKPTHIVARMWEIIRCHYLLWQLGIAHGDISYWNLMVRRTNNGDVGVVNDFDLAAIMTPGQQSPTKQGFERTGTKPFMALALLTAVVTGPAQRRCCHDLESIVWCLLWYVTEGVAAWREGSLTQVGAMKNLWIDAAKPKQLPEQYRSGSEHLWGPLVVLFAKWKALQQDVFKMEIEEYSDKANMMLVEKFLPGPKRASDVEWDWMDWKVEAEDIREQDRAYVQTP